MSNENYHNSTRLIHQYLLDESGYMRVSELKDWWKAANRTGTLERKQWLGVVMMEVIASAVDRENYNNVTQQIATARAFFPDDGSFTVNPIKDMSLSVIAAAGVIPAIERSRDPSCAYVEVSDASGVWWTGPHEIVIAEKDRLDGVDFVNGTGVFISTETFAWFPFDYLKAARGIAREMGFFPDVILNRQNPNFQHELISAVQPLLL